jgi:hypothetical protein
VETSSHRPRLYGGVFAVTRLGKSASTRSFDSPHFEIGKLSSGLGSWTGLHTNGSSAAQVACQDYLQILLARKLFIRLQIIRHVVWLLRSRLNGIYGLETEARLLAWH